MESNKQKVRTSMMLSKILRHSAVEMQIPIDEGGWVSIYDLKKVNRLKNLSFEYLKDIVENNNKKRFELKVFDGLWKIRAVQGHTIKTVEDEHLL